MCLTVRLNALPSLTSSAIAVICTEPQRDQLLVVVRLYRSLGGGWQLPDEGWESDLIGGTAATTPLPTGGPGAGSASVGTLRPTPPAPPDSPAAVDPMP